MQLDEYIALIIEHEKHANSSMLCHIHVSLNSSSFCFLPVNDVTRVIRSCAYSGESGCIKLQGTDRKRYYFGETCACQEELCNHAANGVPSKVVVIFSMLMFFGLPQ